jgi:predicted lysophospholipase L1 biosynthesis ABC-type transport system permease subunit
MKQDRFLIGILAAIGVLVVASVVVFLVRGNDQTYLPDDTPEGVVHNFVLAIQQRDVERVYGYLADKDYKPTYDEVRQALMIDRIGDANNGVQIVSSNVNGDEAIVDVNIIFAGGGPFQETYSNSGTALLVKQSGVWKIESMSYPFWSWNWYSEPPKP